MLIVISIVLRDSAYNNQQQEDIPPIKSHIPSEHRWKIHLHAKEGVKLLKRAAIYHFTDKSAHRPKIYRDQLNTLKAHALSLGFDEVDVFCDMSLKRFERVEFDRFLSCSEQYDALITKDFYHISKNTGKCMDILQELRKKGLQIYSIENGIYISEDPPLDKTLRAVSYTCIHGSPDERKEILPVKNDILKLFAAKKTNWILTDQYTDQSPHQRDREQIQLKKLLDNKDKYDILLVHTLNDINWRTANFCKIRDQLHMDIYSLQEGLLRYRKRMTT